MTGLARFLVPDSRLTTHVSNRNSHVRTARPGDRCHRTEASRGRGDVEPRQASIPACPLALVHSPRAGRLWRPVHLPNSRAFYLSIFDWSGVGSQKNVIWFDNFSNLLQSNRFWRASWHSLRLFAFIFVFQNTISLGLALMLNRRSRMTHIYRAIIFLPVIMSAVATGVVWILMLDPIIGVINPFLRDIGLGLLAARVAGRSQTGPPDDHGRPGLAMERDGRRPLSCRASECPRRPEEGRQDRRRQHLPGLPPHHLPDARPGLHHRHRPGLHPDLPRLRPPLRPGRPTGAPDGATILLGVQIYGDAFGTSPSPRQPG